MVHDLAEWERPEPPVFDLDRSLIPLFSPRSKSLPEVRTSRDLTICRTIDDGGFRIGDSVPGWEISYSQEFNMTSDSKLFPPREKWEERGFRSDQFGRWIGPDGTTALPLYQGGMIHQFNFSQKGWLAGLGHSANWMPISHDNTFFGPRFLMDSKTYCSSGKSVRGIKVGFRDIARNTDERTMIASVICDLPCGNSLPLLTTNHRSFDKSLVLSAVLNSLVFDFSVRQRGAGTHLNWFLVEEAPLPMALTSLSKDSPLIARLLEIAGRTSLNHRRFAPEWLVLKSRLPHLSQTEWKRLWAVTEADRLRLRIESESLCAECYKLDPSDLEWIIRDDRTDPKGFWRIDKGLPYPERLTGLVASAFRALKEGKWSAESAVNLTNNEFFDAIGIPELTDVDAAESKGLPAPLIERREGCHVWNPQSFSPDDPRFGWTWDHCWQDAVSVCGSDDDVRKYMTQSEELVESTQVSKSNGKRDDNQLSFF